MLQMHSSALLMQIVSHLKWSQLNYNCTEELKIKHRLEITQFTQNNSLGFQVRNSA